MLCRPSRRRGQRGRRAPDGALTAIPRGPRESWLPNTRIQQERLQPRALQRLANSQPNPETGNHRTKRNPAAKATGFRGKDPGNDLLRSEEHTSELQSLMRISYAVFCLKKKNTQHTTTIIHTPSRTNHHDHQTRLHTTP